MRDNKRAIAASYAQDGRIYSLHDENQHQVYNGDVFLYDENGEDRRYVKIQKAMGSYSRMVFVTLCNEHGDPIKDQNHRTYSAKLSPEYLGLHWESRPIEDSETRCYKKRQQRKAFDKRNAAIRIKSMKESVSPADTDETIRLKARSLSIDFDYVRKYRDYLQIQMQERLVSSGDSKKAIGGAI